MLLYSTILGKKIAQAPRGHRRFMFTKLVGETEQIQCTIECAYRFRTPPPPPPSVPNIEYIQGYMKALTVSIPSLIVLDPTCVLLPYLHIQREFESFRIFHRTKKKIRIYSVSPQCFLWPPVTNYMLLYSTLLCKKIARVPGGHKRFMLTKRGGGETE